MDHLCAVLLALSTLAPALPGQQPPASAASPLRIEPSLPEFASLAEAAARPPAAGAPLHEFAAACVGRLRLGDADGSRRMLTAGRDRLADCRHDGAALGWLVAAHLWHRRATGAAACSAVGLGPLVAGLESAASSPPAREFAAEAMLVHGMFCLGALLDVEVALPTATEPPRPEHRPGARWTARAIDRQLELERRAWQPGLGHFRPRLVSGEIALPEPAELSLLLPAAAGLLIATGDRLDRHLRTVIAAPLEPPDDRPVDGWSLPMLRLVASSQLGLHSAMAASWSEVLADHRATPGFALDALLFGLTGVRVASGAGLDEQWLRCRPWLPPDLQQVEVPLIVAGGARFALQLRAEGNDAVFVITRLDHGAAPCTLVVDDGTRQHVQVVSGGETVTGRSTRSHAELQHELPLRGRGHRGR